MQSEIILGRITGAAITHFWLIQMLETNSYVRCLCVDFSKVFDHNILSAKLAQLYLPAQIFQWLLSLLSGRTQQVKVGTEMSRSY